MKRHKIVLYNPHAVFFDMPLALLAVGSALDARRYEVIIIDGRLEKHAVQTVLAACQDALCFGLTALTGAPLLDALRVSRAVKERFPDLPVVWGGWHPSLFPVETLGQEPAVDVAVSGQGELTFREIVDRIVGGADLMGVPGATFRTEDGTIVRNPGRHLEDMNTLPCVNYELIDVEAYFKKKKRRQFDYISSTGCRFRCAFCADPFVYDRGWTGLEPERMGEELAYWQRKYGFTDINFQDETFFTKEKRVDGIARQFLDKQIKTTWAGTLRADQGFRLSDEVFDRCKRAGLRRVLVGVESGSQVMLDWLQKDIKLEQVYHTARRCRERNIAVIFPFIVGFPNETPDSVEATLRVAAELNALAPNFETPIFYFKPYPGSKITQEVVANGYQLPQTIEEWARFDYIGSSGPWVAPQLYRRIERFKFYNRLAWQPPRWWKRPLQWAARARLHFDFFDWPVEKSVVERIRPAERLS